MSVLDICMIARSVPEHHIGGMETVSWALANELASAGHRMEIITTPVHTAANGIVTLTPLAGPPGRYSREWAQEVVTYLKGREHQPDIVIGVSASAFVAVDAYSKLPPPHRPVILMQAHGTLLMEFRSKLRSRSPKQLIASLRDLALLPRDLWYYRKVDRVVSVGPAVSGSLMEAPISWFLSHARIDEIQNGVDEASFRFSAAGRNQVRSAFNIPPRAPVLLAIGRLHEQKRFDRTFRLLKSLSAPDAVLLIVGDGPAREGLLSLSHELGVAERTRFVPSIAHHDVANYLSSADVMLFPSTREEGLSMVLLEAIANGLSVVVDKGSNAPDSLGPPILRFDFENGDADELLRNAIRATHSRLPMMNRLSFSAERYITLHDAVKRSQRSS